jgi:hypothetical protein
VSLFKKAEPQQAFVKASGYGPPGSGKTFTTLLLAEGLAGADGRRVAYVDTERGTDFYAQPVENRQVHPGAFDFDAVYTRSVREVTQAVQSLDPTEHSVIVIDSISHLWEASMDAYEGKKTKIDTIPFHAWHGIKKPYKDLIKFLIGAPFHIFILGRQKNVFEDDPDGQTKKVGVTMRAEGETAYEPHICLRHEARVSQKDATQSTYLVYVEKDRTGVLSGRTFANPGFDMIAPILPLLGEKQAPSEDEDARIDNDAETLRDNEAAKGKKATKSAEVLAELQTAIASASTVEEIGEVSKLIKKKRRSLTDEHLSALKPLYETKRDEIVAKSQEEF